MKEHKEYLSQKKSKNISHKSYARYVCYLSPTIKNVVYVLIIDDGWVLVRPIGYALNLTIMLTIINDKVNIASYISKMNSTSQLSFIRSFEEW